MFYRFRVVLTFFCLGLFIGPSHGQILVEQVSQAFGNPHDGSVGISSSNADAILEESLAWTNFTLSNDATIDGLTWRGAFNNVFNPDGTRGENDFVINFYNNVNNEPELTTPIRTFNLDGGTAGTNDGTQVTEAIAPNETQRDGGAIVDYESDLIAFDLDAGNYWLSIQAIQTLPSPISVHDDPQWSWVFSSEGSGGSFSFDEVFDDFQPGLRLPTINATFSLLGEFDTPPGILGDFDSNGVLEAADIDLLAQEACDATHNPAFDLTGDGLVDVNDHVFWYSDLANSLVGDVNLNGTVGFDDFLVLSTNFGQPGGWGQGNFDLDKVVAFADFLQLSSNFGRSASAAPTASAVPEPSAAGLLGIGVFLCGFLRRKRR